MIFENCAFDPVRDLTPVDQYGFIDMKSALANSVVPSVMPGAEVDYNGIDDPASILGKPSDIFEAIEMQRAVEAASAKSDEASNE